MTRRDRQANIARSVAAAQALKLFQKLPAYASVQVQIADESAALAQQQSDESKRVLTNARMEHIVKLFDIIAKAYLPLVTDLEIHKAYATLLEEYGRRSWTQFTGLRFEVMPPIGDDVARLRGRLRYWTVEGYRQISTSSVQPAPINVRKTGHRNEIREWMKSSELSTNADAARALGISIDTLKSIMSDKGEVRYAQETLNAVLEKIRKPKW